MCVGLLISILTGRRLRLFSVGHCVSEVSTGIRFFAFVVHPSGCAASKGSRKKSSYRKEGLYLVELMRICELLTQALVNTPSHRACPYLTARMIRLLVASIEHMTS